MKTMTKQIVKLGMVAVACCCLTVYGDDDVQGAKDDAQHSEKEVEVTTYADAQRKRIEEARARADAVRAGEAGERVVRRDPEVSAEATSEVRGPARPVVSKEDMELFEAASKAWDIRKRVQLIENCTNRQLSAVEVFHEIVQAFPADGVSPFRFIYERTPYTLTFILGDRRSRGQTRSLDIETPRVEMLIYGYVDQASLAYAFKEKLALSPIFNGYIFESTLVDNMGKEGQQTYFEFRTSREEAEKVKRKEMEWVSPRDVLDSVPAWMERYENVRTLIPVFEKSQQVDIFWFKRMDVLATKCDIKLFQRKIGGEVVLWEDVYELPIYVEWDGALANLLKFLRAMQSDGMMIDVRKLEIRPHPDQPGIMQGNFSLNCAYIRADETKNGNP